MLKLLLPLGLFACTWPFTELLKIQAGSSLNFTEIDPQFKVREKRQIELTIGPSTIDPQCRICGVSASATLRAARVINGIPVRPRWKYPWTVPLIVKGNPLFHCGAALINREFVLTAAHCMVYTVDIRGQFVSGFFEPKDVKVAILGESHKEPIGLLELSHIYVHPQYDNYNHLNDVALLRLAMPLSNCNAYIAPICLPLQPLSKRGQEVVVAGWGRNVGNIPVVYESMVFREGRVIEVDSSFCQRSNKQRRKEKIYCTTTTPLFNQSSCMGDSGSSVFASFNGVFYSLGVTSFGSSDCAMDNYVNFANTHGYLDWILPIVGSLPQPPFRNSIYYFGS